MATIANNIAQVRGRIRDAAQNCDRSPEDIGLIAVTKTHPATAVREAFENGLTHVGENYLQEALDKQAQLQNIPLIWHFIGPIQSNKTKAIAENFDWVHSVERLKIAERLSAQRPSHLPPLNICLQVNVSGEASKSGCSPAELPALAAAIAALPNLRLRGLMALPAPTDDIDAQKQAFAQVRQWQAELPQTLDTLSMGMSHDLEAAVAEGATWVRIGTAIFGSRPAPTSFKESV